MRYTLSLILVLAFVFSKAEIRAVLVGVEEYNHHESHIRNLNGCLNDVHDFQIALQTKYLVASKNIKVLKNEEATKSDILTALKQPHLKPGDHFVFYFAGHGSQVKNSLSNESDHKDECILPYDAYLGPTHYIRDKEIKKSLNALLERNIKVTAVFDACHSGSITRGSLVKVNERFTLGPNNYDSQDPDPIIPLVKSGAVILSAAQDNQTAKEFTDSKGFSHGAFTFSLVKAMYESSPNTPINALFQKAHAKLAYLGLDQEPVLTGDPQRLFNNLLDKPVKNSEDKLVVLEKFDSEGNLVFEAGSLQGLAPKSILEKDGLTAEIKEITAPSLSKAKLNASSTDNLHVGDFFKVIKAGSYEADPLFVYVDPQIEKLDQTWAKEITNYCTNKFYLSSTMSEQHPIIFFNSEVSAFFLETKDEKLKLRKSNWKALINELNTEYITLNFGLNNNLLSEAKDKIESHPNWEFTTSADQANYQLTFFTDSLVKVKLVNVRQSYFINNKSLLPIETNSLKSIEGETKGDLSLSKIARLHYWYTLENSADEQPFVYDLVLQSDIDTNSFFGGEVYEKERFGISLKANKNDLLSTYKQGKLLEAMYVYVFTIDKDGFTQLLYPLYGNVDNHYPLEKYGMIEDRILLGQQPLFEISPPFGKDSFFLLCTYQAIPDPTVLNNSGVQYRSSSGITRIGDLIPQTRSSSGKGYKIKRITFESKAR